MSEDLLLKFIADIEQEEDIGDARRKAKNAKRDLRRGQANAAREVAKIELKAASRGTFSLSDDQAYLRETRTSKDAGDRRKGVSLIEEARSRVNADNSTRNIKYMKYADKLKIAGTRTSTILEHHGKRLKDGDKLRSQRAAITGLREPKAAKFQKKSKDTGSIFSEADFANIKKKVISKGKYQNEDGVFL